MVYKNFDEWLKSNTNNAHTIIKHRIKNKKDKESLEDTLAWLEREIEQKHKTIKWLEDATREVCSKEQYLQIQKLYIVFMHDDFITNCPWGRELFENGQIDAASSKIVEFPNEE